MKKVGTKLQRGILAALLCVTWTAGAQTRPPRKAPAKKARARPAAKPGPRPAVTPKAKPNPYARSEAVKRALAVLAESFKPRPSTALRARAPSVTTASRMGPRPRGLGELVPIAEVVRRIEAAEKSGQALPGDALPTQYRQWEEAKRRKEIPADAAPPGELRREDRELYQKQYVGELLKDLEVYIPFVYDRVFLLERRLPEKKEIAELLYQYGCRQISRLMPGFAKITQKRLAADVDLVGDWTEPIEPGALPPAGKKPGGGARSSGPAPYKPKPKEEIVEVCTVTHVQLEHTLKKDLELLVSAVRPARGDAEADVQPLSGLPSRPQQSKPAAPKAAERKVKLPFGVTVSVTDLSHPTFEPEYDRPGGDYKNVPVRSGQECHSLCHRDPRCRAFTFAYGTCYLKDTIAAPRSAAGMISGARPAIVVTSADYGRNCGMKRGSRERCGGLGGCGATQDSDITADVKRACDGRPTCTYTVRHPHRPHGMCQRRVEIEFHCGDPSRPQPKVETPHHHEIFGKPVTLSCAPFISEVRQESESLAATATVTEKVSIDKAPRQVREALWIDIGEKYNDKLYKGVTFHDAAKRLLNFYRKTGLSRNFERAVAETGNKVKDMAGRVGSKAPEPARGEDLRHQTAGSTVDTRNRREVLRRKVERWTYGYEYEQVKEVLRKKGGQLLRDYVAAEKAVLEDFWTDCEEIQSACHDPKKPYETDLCLRCAERAVRSYCIEGQEKDYCKTADPTMRARGGGTFFNWLAVRAISEAENGDFVKGSLGDLRLEETVARNLVRRHFLPKQPDQRKGISDEGRRTLEALPLTPWQRCVLWHPNHSRNAAVCAKPDGKMEDLKGQRNVAWHQARLFKMILDDPSVKAKFALVKSRWARECSSDRARCKELAREAEKKAQEYFGEEDTSSAGVKSDLAKAGDAIGDALAPIVGALLGLLLKAEGMDQMVKTLGNAAGLTPEQSADCEDPEYRREVMQLPQGDLDNKRTCLLKVFAKNFGTVLESVVVMLGNKLVDWGIDMLRTLLQPVKSALISAAGSVPFAGGFLAMLVDIGWELLMNFGAKALLKGFVVAKLPEWLQLKKLAEAMKLEDLTKNPVLAVIFGIVVQLIESAVAYGDKSLAVAGAASVITGIQHALQSDPKNHFWLRALLYAKRELAREGPGTESPEAVLRFIARGMIRGFGAAIERNLDNRAAPGEKSPRQQFSEAVRDIEGLLEGAGWARFQSEITRDPVGALVKVIGQKIGPVVMPIITSFVSMPDWAKELLNRIGSNVSATLEELTKGRVNAPQLIARIVDTFEPVGKMLLSGLPIHDPLLREMIDRGYDALAGVLKNVANLERDYLRQPWRIVEGVVGLVKDFLKGKVGELVADPNLAPEKRLVEGAVGAILDVLGDARARGEILGSSGVNVDALLSRVADLVQPYAAERLRQLASGSGLEDLVVSAVNELFGAEGPFKRGRAFFQNLGNLLRTRGPGIAQKVLEAVAGIVRRQAERLGGGPIVGGLIQGVLGAVGRAVQSPGVLSGGAAGVLSLVREAFQPVLEAIAPSAAPASGQASALTGMLRNVLGGILDLFGNSETLGQLARDGVRALGALAGRVASGLKEAVKSLLGQAISDSSLRGIADRAVDRVFALLSDPAEVTRLRGEQVLDLVKEIGQALFGYVKGKIVTALGGAGGDAGQALRAAASGILDEAERLIGEPARLRSLVTGGARDLLGAVGRALQAPVRSLVEKLAPAPVREALLQAASEALAFLTNPTQVEGLGRLTPGDLLPRIAPVAQRLLEGILRTAVPASAFAPIQTALGQVQAVLANPASAAEQAGETARQAIDSAIAAAVMRIPDAGLRDLATELVSMVGDLVSPEAARNRLRTDLPALLQRLAGMAARYLGGLVPAGPIREIVSQAAAGLRELFAHTGGLEQALAQRAQALLPGVVRALGGLVREGLAQAIPDAAIGAAVSGLVDEVLGFVGDSSRWQELRRGGFGYVLSRLAPIARDFAVSMLARLPGDAGQVLRGVVESLLGAATQLLSSPEGVARFAENAVSALVSMGVGAVKPAVLGLVERATGSADVAGFLRTALGELEGVLGNPAQLQGFLRMTAAQAFERLLGHARTLAERLVSTVVKDEDLKTLAQQGLSAVLEFVRRAAQGGAEGLETAVKAIVARLLPAVAGLVKSKLGPLFPHQLSALKTIVERGLDRLVAFGTQLLERGQAAWDGLVGGGRIFGELVQAVLPLVKEPVVRAVSWRPLQGLLSRLLDEVGALLADPAKLVRSFQNANTAMAELFPKLKAILEPFVTEALVNPLPAGIGKDFMRKVLDAGMSLLGDPGKLQRYVQAGSDPKRFVACVLDDLKPAILGQLPGGQGGALYQVLSGGLDFMAQQALGTVRCTAAGR